MVGARLFKPGESVPGTKYRVVRQLGAGGMGVVYQVTKPPQIGGVLKLMAADLAIHEEFRTRFFDEVRVLAQLDHPNIVRVFDYDAIADGTPYYVMEMLHGSTVRDVLGKVGRLPARVAFEVTRQLLEALHCAHTNVIPVVHRDIKPENIFLHAPRHGEPVVKLIDFGVVAIADRDHDGTFVGTWKYAAPEQIRGEQATPATDLYAVGLVLYEMLAGAGPFDHYETGPAVATAHVRETPAPVSRLAPWVPSSIVALIASALAKDPKQRPKDAYAFAEKLYELEWASDGQGPHDATKEGPVGPLQRVLTDVGGLEVSGERASGGKIAAAAVPESAKHKGATIVGVGDGSRHEPTSPDDDALLAGLLAREQVGAAGGGGISRKARESDPHGVGDPAPTPPSGQVVIRPSPSAPEVVVEKARPSAHDAVTMEAPPSDPRLPASTKKVDTDTFAASETDAGRKSKKKDDAFGRFGVPALLMAGALVAAFVVVLLVMRRRPADVTGPLPVMKTEALGAQPPPVESTALPTTTGAPEARPAPEPKPRVVTRPPTTTGATKATAVPATAVVPSATAPHAAPAASSGTRPDLIRNL